MQLVAGLWQGTGMGRGQQAGLGAELGTHRTPLTEHGPQKGSGSAKVASSATWEGEDEEQAHFAPNPKRQQPWVPLGGWQQGRQCLCHRPGGCHHLCTSPAPSAGQGAQLCLSCLSPPETTASPRRCAGIKRGSYLIKVGMGAGYKTLRHPRCGGGGGRQGMRKSRRKWGQRRKNIGEGT